MKTNLIFKRQEVVDGTTKVITKIIPVEVPFINSGEGWILSGHTDTVEIMSDASATVTSATTTSVSTKNKPATEKKKSRGSDDPSKFISPVSGTAKLVRVKGVIKIVARRGKSTYNQTTPNSVCIDDSTKNNFFANCRVAHGNTGCFEFSPADGSYYDYWNKAIDTEYTRQKTIVENNKKEDKQ